jgi:excisionase family DNA binding protein
MGRRTDREQWATQEVFSTGEAAGICNVSQQTIIRCFDMGRLQGFRVPGSRFRRIPRESLLRFMRENGIPTAPLESARKQVLLVENDQQIVELFRYTMDRDARYQVSTAASSYEAGVLTEQLKPDLILVDAGMPDLDAEFMCRRVKANPLLHARIVVLTNGLEPKSVDAFRASGADDVVRKPFNVAHLVTRMDDLLGV